ncbi:hypothetical protein [Massilia sp. S19_KUP03_FR1]|uniref:hypothetical protein n=1 Tax=Massilia sp. S19_KUP03_FR1 TaxID=3025503 RepID=UPI002FCD9BAF
MSVRMKSLGALALVAGMAGASPPVATDAHAVVAPWTAQASDGSSFSAPDRARTRLPAPTDVGVAWDQIGHRGQLRWECRAVPSGWFVMASLCAKMPQVDARWPGNAAPPGWDGVVHGD